MSERCARKRAGRPQCGTELDLTEIVRRRVAGESYREIAIAMGCSHQAIALRLARDAEESESDLPPPARRVRRPIDEDELLALRNGGTSINAIADIFGCARSTVSARLVQAREKSRGAGAQAFIAASLCALA